MQKQLIYSIKGTYCKLNMLIKDTENNFPLYELYCIKKKNMNDFTNIWCMELIIIDVLRIEKIYLGLCSK